MLKPLADRTSKAPKPAGAAPHPAAAPSSAGRRATRSSSSPAEPISSQARSQSSAPDVPPVATYPQTPLSRPHQQIQPPLTELTLPGRLQRARLAFLRPDRAYNDRPAVPTIACLPPGAQAPRLIDMLRSENASPLISPNPSRRQSLLVSKDGDGEKEKLILGDGDGDGDGSLRSTESKLRRSITDLDAFSTDAAQTLNDTCDAMQDKMASLQEIVIALKQLAEASRDIHDGFTRASHEIESDVSRQLDAMGQFKGQQDTIEHLQRRIHRERRRIESLSARVEVVRQRVEGWEEADKAWQEKTRKRLTIAWTALTIVAMVLLGLLIFVEYRREGVESVSRADVEVPSVREIPHTSTTTHPRQLEANSTTACPSDDKLATGNDSGAGVDPIPEDDGENKENTETETMPERPADDTDWLRAFDEL